MNFVALEETFYHADLQVSMTYCLEATPVPAAGAVAVGPAAPARVSVMDFVFSDVEAGRDLGFRWREESGAPASEGGWRRGFWMEGCSWRRPAPAPGGRNVLVARWEKQREFPAAKAKARLRRSFRTAEEKKESAEAQLASGRARGRRATRALRRRRKSAAEALLVPDSPPA